MARKQVKSERPSKGALAFDGRWTGEDRFLRSALSFYMHYEETRNPVLDSAAAAPLVDRFGRTRAGQSEMHNIAEGAVWFTRATLEAAWFETFKQVSNLDRNPDHYHSHMDGTGRTPYIRANGRRTHPMDWTVTRMVKDGRLLKGGRDRFMVAWKDCARLEMGHVWDIYLARRTRWEEIGAHRTSKSMARDGWNDVLASFNDTVILDRHMLVERAREDERITRFDPSAISRQLNSYVESGTLLKIAHGLYTRPTWDVDPATPQVEDQFWLADWLHEFLRQRAPYQYKTQGKDPFTAQGLMEEVHNYPDAWRSQHLPNDLVLKSVFQRLALSCFPGACPADEALVTRPSMGFYNISDRMMEFFRPVRFITLSDKAMRVLEQMMSHGSLSDPLWFTRVDVELSYPEVAAESTGIISYLKGEGFIRYKQDLDYHGQYTNHISFSPTPVYITTEKAYDLFKYEAKFDSEAYVVPTTPTGLPTRIDPIWARTSGYRRWFKPFHERYKEVEDRP